MDVLLASCATLPEPDPDAAPLAEALGAAGIRHAVCAWDDPAVDWAAAPLTVLRSTWNYPFHHHEFLRWTERVQNTSTLWNPAAVVAWNSHKGYLLELAHQGVAVTPTTLVGAGSDETLERVMDAAGWEEVVVKPAVSASSYKTMLVDRSRLAGGEAHLRDLVERGDALVQQYLPAVDGYGERAVVWIDGALTHSVRKAPRFHGGHEAVTGPHPISDSERALAEAALAMVDAPLMYGRVDMAPGPGGDPVVMELELIEPSLFFDQSPPALERFVAAIRKRLALVPQEEGDQPAKLSMTRRTFGPSG